MDLQTLRARLLARRAKWQEIADRAGLHRKTLQRIADGRNIPSMVTAEKIGNAMRRKSTDVEHA